MNNTSSFECPVCREFYVNPKTLPCQHTFCQKCLVKLATKEFVRVREVKGLKCAVCREFCNKQEPDISVNRTVRDMVESQRDMLQARANSESQVICAKHDQSAEMVCLDCQSTPVCLKCMNDHPRHHLMNRDEFEQQKLREIIPKRQEEVKNILESKKILLEAQTDAKKLLEVALGKLQEDIQNTQKDLGTAQAMQASIKRMETLATSNNFRSGTKEVNDFLFPRTDLLYHLRGLSAGLAEEVSEAVLALAYDRDGTESSGSGELSPTSPSSKTPSVPVRRAESTSRKTPNIPPPLRLQKFTPWGL